MSEIDGGCGMIETIYGRDGRHSTPYLTRIFLLKTRWGRLQFHIFHRGDEDPDPHDHPWDFWTLPLTSYIEEVRSTDGSITKRLVAAGRVHFRPAEFTHRLLCRAAWAGGKIYSLVWVKCPRRKWGFYTSRGWVPWREYVFDRPDEPARPPGGDAA